VDRIVSDISNAVDQGEKVIVFTQYTKTLEKIADGVRKLKIENDGKKVNVECVTLSGVDKMEARQESVDRFQNDENVKVFVANIKAGGVGLTLTAGSIVMFADMDWSPEVHSQAEDRAHRIGQNRMVNVYYYMAPDTIEEDIVGLLTEKKKIIDEILDGKKDTVRESSVAEEFLKRMSQKLPTV
jgi:SWI/SNF-related matrix-associated actin-dependent regulator 1 of chromatin subfamily A